MPIEHALTPYDLSGMQIQPVPELWPPPEWAPADCPPPVSLPRQQQAEPDGGGRAWPRQFAVLLVEALTGDRPARQVMPWLSERGSVHLRRLLPLFASDQRARVQRVMTTQPAPDVIEMTLIVAVGPRVRALAVRLKQTAPTQRPGWRENRPNRTPTPTAPGPGRWLCTDIEAA